MIGRLSDLRRPVLWLALPAAMACLMLATATASAAPSQPHGGETLTSQQEAEGPSYQLDFRWSAWGWLGQSGVDIMTALENNTSPDGDLTDRVTAIYSWDQEEQQWNGFFPAGIGIPGVNNFDSFTRLEAYFVAITEGESVTFTPPAQ